MAAPVPAVPVTVIPYALFPLESMRAADPTADAFDCVDSERDAGRSMKMMPLPFVTPDVPKVMVAVTIRSRPSFR